MAKKFTPPNWYQKLIAQAVGLDPKNVTVEYEDDRNINFLQYVPRKNVIVGKADGTWVESCQTGSAKGYENYGRANI